jgi:hypothetical protein
MRFSRYEEQRETFLQWELIRERETHCATGYPESCDYFHSEFVNDDEFMYEGCPFAFNPLQKRNVFSGNILRKN